MATQEVIWATRPDVAIETGIARGGSVLFMASLLELLGKGKVVGVDIDIRPHNRETIERHPMAKCVVLFEGSSTHMRRRLRRCKPRFRQELRSWSSGCIRLTNDDVIDLYNRAKIGATVIVQR